MKPLICIKNKCTRGVNRIQICKSIKKSLSIFLFLKIIGALCLNNMYWYTNSVALFNLFLIFRILTDMTSINTFPTQSIQDIRDVITAYLYIIIFVFYCFNLYNLISSILLLLHWSTSIFTRSLPQIKEK